MYDLDALRRKIAKEGFQATFDFLVSENLDSKVENDKIKVTKKGKIKTTKIGYFFDCKKIV